jgi:hypothetical protein
MDTSPRLIFELITLPHDKKSAERIDPDKLSQ